VAELFRILSTCKGGGYRYCRTDPPHPRRNAKGLYPLHRVLAENRLGRLLRPGEIAHHADGNKANDDPANIEVLANAEHSRLHASRVRPIEVRCVQCGRRFELKPHEYRLRDKRATRGIHCSLRCAGLARAKT
jgi:hypothetical protein